MREWRPLSNVGSRMMRFLVAHKDAQAQHLSACCLYLYTLSKAVKTLSRFFQSWLGASILKDLHASSLVRGRCVCRSTLNLVELPRLASAASSWVSVFSKASLTNSIIWLRSRLAPALKVGSLAPARTRARRPRDTRGRCRLCLRELIRVLQDSRK